MLFRPQEQAHSFIRGIPGQIDQRLTPSYIKKIWNLVYGVVWHAKDDWANIRALQARVNE